MTKDMLDDVVKAIPARRAGQPEEVAAACASSPPTTPRM